MKNWTDDMMGYNEERKTEKETESEIKGEK